MRLSESDLNADIGSKAKDVTPDLYSSLQELRRYSFDYVVIITRRASNMVESVRREHPELLSDYITENGLLLEAEKIAKVYKETGRFPQIAILDDILVYGRNMNLLLTQFWNTLRLALLQMGVDAETEEVEQEFNQSITLWIYAVNDAPILLRHEFRWSMHSQQMLPESQWRKLSDSIARHISNCDVANTSYIVSARLKRSSDSYQPDSASWVSDSGIQYRKNRHFYYFHLFCHSPKADVYPSVRSYWKQGFQYFTPYFFMPELDSETVFRVLKKMFDFSFKQNRKVTNSCIDLLNRTREYSSRLMVYAQFVFFALSQITLSVFFHGRKELDCLDYDTDKISRNFGPVDIVEPILEGFCKLKWEETQLIKLLECMNSPGQEETSWALPAAKNVDCGLIVDVMEGLVYEQAVEHERDAARRQQYDSSEYPGGNRYVNSAGEQDLTSFLSWVRQDANVHADVVSMLPVLSCLTQMTDLGDLSLRARSKRRGEKLVFYSSVRTTEMSLAIMPRKIFPYYHQFFLLAQFYWREKNFPDRVESYFRDLIFGGDRDGKHRTLIRNARRFAQLISENRIIVNSMLNWNNLTEP